VQWKVFEPLGQIKIRKPSLEPYQCLTDKKEIVIWSRTKVKKFSFLIFRQGWKEVEFNPG